MKKMAVLLVTAGLVLAGSLGASVMAEDKIKDRFKKHDSNGDGIVSHQEMKAQVQAKFDEYDQNRDGFVELNELPVTMPVPSHKSERRERRRSKMQEKMAERGHEMPEKFAEHMEQHGKPTRIKFIAKLDRDGDERVSVEEYMRKAIKHFKHRDVNGDGNVTLEEIETARSHRMAKRLKNKQRHQD